MGVNKPRRQEYRIATVDGDGEGATRVGWTLGDWGATKVGYFWKFTHLPTGVGHDPYPCHDTKAGAFAHLAELNAGTHKACAHIADLLLSGKVTLLK